MAERPSRIYSAIFAIIALVLGWVIVRDHILEPDAAPETPSTTVDVPASEE